MRQHINVKQYSYMYKVKIPNGSTVITFNQIKYKRQRYFCEVTDIKFKYLFAFVKIIYCSAGLRWDV